MLITVKGASSRRVQEKLDEIDVYFSLQPDHVIAKTQIEENWSLKFFKSARIQYRIDYTIKLPRSSKVDLTNDYGSIALNALDGSAKIHCDFGKLLIGALNSETTYSTLIILTILPSILYEEARYKPIFQVSMWKKPEPLNWKPITPPLNLRPFKNSILKMTLGS